MMTHAHRSPSLLPLALGAAAALALGCSGALSAPADGGDTVLPTPIDRDATVAGPTSYKGLALRLADTGAPTVTAVDGVVGMVCVGMSNSNQECADFIVRRNGEYDAAVHPAVRVVNCAVGGHAIERWIDAQYDATLWDACIGTKLAAAGVRLDQVRVVYHKAANQFTTGTGGVALPTYPAADSDFENFRDNLEAFDARVRTKFPALQAVYTSSRSYGGFAGSVGRGEPLSYEEGHALNVWLRDHTAVNGVWHGWGPYLWAPECGTGGAGGTNGGGICYDRADYVTDGVHPSATGTAKVSALLHARLLREAWYRR